MTDKATPGIYLIIDFDWPSPPDPEAGRKASHLHTVLKEMSWVREAVAASGGIGAGPSSTWILRLENYAALDRLLRDPSDEGSRAYVDFFGSMQGVVEKIREEVVFR